MGDSTLNSTATDLDGNSRTRDLNTDLGAYEFQDEFVAVNPANGRVYVKQRDCADFNITNDGSSWDRAYPRLADVLHYAQSRSDINEIWVAEGVYTPRYVNTARRRNMQYCL